VRGARGDEKELAELPIMVEGESGLLAIGPPQYQANTAGCRKGSRPTLVTMSLSFMRGWPKAFGTANLPALDLMLRSLVIG
jgi:hypothetical protein